MHAPVSAFALGGALFAASGAAHIVHGVLVFSRHGDRTAKHFGNASLTSLGAQQVFQVGSDYRARYLSSASSSRISKISEFEYVPAQVWASAPDEPILLGTATAFLQGLYPPLGDVQPTLTATGLANGSSVSGPLSGYQYVTLHGVDDESPETVWIKGDDNCPAVKAASASFNLSAEYQAREAATRDFYRGLYPLLSDYYASADDLSYTKAFDIFDLVNVERIHNASSPARNISDADFLQLRTLADSAEFGANFNASQPARSIHARTFAAAVVRHLNQTLSSTATKQQPKFTLLTGSYDTFLAFFGLAGLTSVSDDFYGLPDYASTMAFELFSPTDDSAGLQVGQPYVRYLFRNGTQGELQAYPLFGTDKEEMPWTEFAGAVSQRGAIGDVGTWCGECRSEAVFCAAYTNNGAGDGAATAVDLDGGSSVGRGSWIAVLVVMAVAIAGNLVWAGMWLVQRQRKTAVAAAAAADKGYDDSVRSYGGKESV
ncbi:histidine phosphatase superfamily [Chaetomium strumarium]|uniref:Histidine phosphatase superfamily n=1 Tax=Chaetomium strumarium TaxID=1170767 RepID=A0AAJ0GUP6_9PEZI|nr:histidine phosphatase superfamily [Chaetomium strumarium]